MNQAIEDRLAALLAGEHTTTGEPLDAGAQMTVTDPDGSEAFRAPLARHYRTDTADPAVIWIRPITGGAPSPEPDGEYVFSLSASRRRSLAVTTAQLDPADHSLILTLRSGQTAHISAAAGPDLEELRRWDNFTLNTLTAQEEADLDLLDEDSWHGRFS